MTASPESSRNIEVELRSFGVDSDAIRETLHTLGAVSLGTQVFKRAVLDVQPPNPNRWIRVRSDGYETTWAVKERKVLTEGATFEGDGEEEQTVESFEKTIKLLSLMGFEPRSIQESRRDSYLLDGAEVSIDTWPYIKDLVEIEAADDDTVENQEIVVRRVAAQLGITPEALTSKAVEDYYQETLGIDVKTTSLTFDSEE